MDHANAYKRQKKINQQDYPHLVNFRQVVVDCPTHENCTAILGFLAPPEDGHMDEILEALKITDERERAKAIFDLSERTKLEWESHYSSAICPGHRLNMDYEAHHHETKTAVVWTPPCDECLSHPDSMWTPWVIKQHLKTAKEHGILSDKEHAAEIAKVG